MDKVRFSLLLLEPGEIYFEDFSAVLFSPKNELASFDAEKQYGRLKMCSKSLVFDPQDWNKPILKILLKDCCNINRCEQTWQGVEDNIMAVECDSYTEMLQGNVIAPYIFKHTKEKFLFLLHYAKVDDCLPQVLQLQRASTLLASEQNSMIATIVFSRQSRVSFDTKWLEDLYEKVVIETQGHKVSPLIVNPGRILLTSSRMYFQPYNNVEPNPVLKINLNGISRIICRRFLLKHVGMEIYCNNMSNTNEAEHLYLVLKSPEERAVLYESIMKQPALAIKTTQPEIMTLKWQNHVLSTYDYLLYLNSLADRSFNDLTQYPVFPWVIADYSSTVLDLDNPKSFRDLTKPIGAINGERLQRLKERCQEMPEPRFLYGSHYSAPGFVLFYLIRKFPHYMLCLQNGRFDHPDRMFNSIADVWRNVTENMSDFKELIPEFYDVSQSGDFLVNKFGINFGHRHNGSKIGNVHLPPWAGSAADFVQKLRLALESDYVSEHLHHWIDLIFGYKQRGPEAELSNNLYYYLCYEGAVDLDSIHDLNKRHALEVQIMEFGQIPKQIFRIPHPSRLPRLSTINEDSSSSDSSKQNSKPYDPCWRNKSSLNSLILAQHKDTVTSVSISHDNEFIVSVSRDSVMKLYSISSKQQTRSLSLSSVGLASCCVLPDNKTIVLGSFDDQILVYDIDFGKVIDSIRAHEDAVTSLCWGEQCQYLVSASWDCSVIVWRGMFQDKMWYRLKSTLTTRFDRDSRVTCISMNRGNTLVSSGTEDGDVIVWSILSKAIVLESVAHVGTVSAVSFSPDDVNLVSCGTDGTFRVYDLLTGMEVYSKTLESQLTCLALDGSSLILGSGSGFLYFWDLIEVKMLLEVKSEGGLVKCIATTSDGGFVVTGENKAVVLRF